MSREENCVFRAAQAFEPVARRTLNAHASRALPDGAIFATRVFMARPIASMLRAEGRLLTIAGLLLLAIGFPLTLILVALALSEEGGSPMLPLAIGAPPIGLPLRGQPFCKGARSRGANLTFAPRIAQPSERMSNSSAPLRFLDF